MSMKNMLGIIGVTNTVIPVETSADTLDDESSAAVMSCSALRAALSRKRVQLLLSIAIVVCVAATTSLYLKAKEDEHRSISDKFQGLATGLHQTTLSLTTVAAKDLAVLAALFVNTPNATLKHFQRVTDALTSGIEGILNGKHHIQAYVWVPLVKAADLSSYEASAMSLYNGTAPMYTRNLDRTPVGPRPLYFPVYFVHPLQGNTHMVLYDLLSDVEQAKPLNTSWHTGKEAASEAFNPSGRNVLSVAMLFHPVYDSRFDGVEMTAQERHDNLLGVIMGAFDLLKLFRWVVQLTTNSNAELSVYDMSAGGQHILSLRGQTQITEAEIDSNPAFVYRFSIPLADRVWRCEMRAIDAYVIQRRSNTPLLLLVVSIALSCVVLATLLHLAVSDEKDRMKEKITSARELSLRHRKEQESTRRLKAELVATANKQFISYIMHEVRVPFNVVVIGLQSLSQFSLPSKAKDIMMMMASSAEHVTRILNDVLDMHKISAGKFELKMEPFSLQRLVHSVGWSFRHVAEDSGVILDFSVADGLDSMVAHGDAGRVRQVLSNFISNSLKFTSAGGRVELMAYAGHFDSARTESAGRVCGDAKMPSPPVKDSPGTVIITFAVCDSGIGISEGNQRKLFRPYVQVHDTRMKKEVGTGLGLALTKRIVELHDGIVGVRSREGVGSVFFVSFPFAVASLDESTRVLSSSESESDVKDLPTRGLRALIVDDSSASRRMLGLFLTQLGLVVEYAADGHLAVDLVCRRLAECKESGGVQPLVSRVCPEPSLQHPTLTRLNRMIAHNTDGLQTPKLMSVGNADLATMLHTPSLGAHEDSVSLDAEPEDAILFSRRHRRRRARRTRTSSNGRESLAADPKQRNNTISAETRFWDIIIMDRTMPTMDGEEATRQIRGMGVTVPIIALTGNAFDEDRESFLAAGATDFLTKPFRRNAFLHVIRHLFESGQIQRRHPDPSS